MDETRCSDRLIDRMILHREKFKRIGNLVKDLEWTLQRFPDMNLRHLVMAIENADTNGLGLRGRLSVLRESGQLCKLSLLKTVEYVDWKNCDIRGTLVELVKPDDETKRTSLVSKLDSILEATRQVFGQNGGSDFQLTFALLSLFRRLDRKRAEKCTRLLNSQEDFDIQTVQDVISALLGINAQSEIVHLRQMKLEDNAVSKPEIPAHHMHAFVHVVSERDRIGYALVWRYDVEGKMTITGSLEGNESIDMSTINAHVMEEALLGFRGKEESRIVFHLTPSVQSAIAGCLSPEAEIGEKIPRVFHRLRDLCANLKVELMENSLHDSLTVCDCKDWRFECSLMALDLATREAQ